MSPMQKSIQLILRDIASRHATFEECKQDGMYKFYSKVVKQGMATTYVRQYYLELSQAIEERALTLPKYF